MWLYHGDIKLQMRTKKKKEKAGKKQEKAVELVGTRKKRLVKKAAFWRFERKFSLLRMVFPQKFPD